MNFWKGVKTSSDGLQSDVKTPKSAFSQDVFRRAFGLAQDVSGLQANSTPNQSIASLRSNPSLEVKELIRGTMHFEYDGGGGGGSVTAEQTFYFNNHNYIVPPPVLAYVVDTSQPDDIGYMVPYSVVSATPIGGFYQVYGNGYLRTYTDRVFVRLQSSILEADYDIYIYVLEQNILIAR